MNTTNGLVEGRLKDGIERFMGIPIAADTFNNRFMPPQPVTHWGYTTPKVTTVEKQCYMAAYPVAGYSDCLTLDIFKPYLTPSEPVPVAMFIHGGGFIDQNPYFVSLQFAPQQKYNFPSISDTTGGKVITALVHYRLGALGWMAHPGFAPDPMDYYPHTSTPYFFSYPEAVPSSYSGNWGMMDTMNAIAWLHENAFNIGADTTKINVYGESAGGAHVTMLMAVPLLDGKVHSFIAESPYISYGPATFSVQARMEMDILITLRTKCKANGKAELPTTDDEAQGEATCLRQAPILETMADANFNGPSYGGMASSTDAVLAFDAAFPSATADIFTYNSIHYWPVVDYFLLTMPPLEAYSTGINAGATMVVGHNTDEYATFCFYPFFPPYDGTFACGNGPDKYNHGWILAQYYLTITASWEDIGEATNKATLSHKYNQLQQGLFYSDIEDQLVMKTIQMGTDAWFSNGVNQVVEGLLVGRMSSTTAKPVYNYLFAEDTDPWSGVMGACHGCELTFVLGYYTVGLTFLSALAPASLFSLISPLLGVSQDSADYAVGTSMNYYWAAIWYTGSATIANSGLPVWEPMGIHEKQTMVFQKYFTSGAAMNPCVRFTSCRTEQAKDWRYAQKAFWFSAPAAPELTIPKCTAAPTGSLTHYDLTISRTLTSTFTYNFSMECSFLPCCTYHSRSRELLFGMPSLTDTTTCDAMC